MTILLSDPVVHAIRWCPCPSRPACWCGRVSPTGWPVRGRPCPPVWTCGSSRAPAPGAAAAAGARGAGRRVRGGDAGVRPLGDRDRLPATAAVVVTFTGNLPVADISAAAFHSWTLATEEQFYLLWPALLAFAGVRGRVGAALVAAAVAVLVACVAVLVWLWPYADNAYVLPTSWFLCFVIGAATRLRGDSTRVPSALVPLMPAALVALSVVPLRGHVLTYLVAGPAIACFTAVLLLAWSRWHEAGSRIARALAALGVVSYGAYLWDYPLTLWLRPDLGAVAGPLAAGLTIVAAALSWRFVEEPVMRRVRSRSP